MRLLGGMRNIEKYYENTKELEPHKNIREFIKTQTEIGNAIELGCGAGRDTKCLLENGWSVLAIDREDVSGIITEKLENKELKRFRFQKQNFESLELEDTNLIVANFSLSFCNKDKFNEMWSKIKNSILSSGNFVGNFFGVNDEWAKLKGEMTFLTKEDVLKLFDEFEIINFKEREEEAMTGMGRMKHWHIFDVTAKKK